MVQVASRKADAHMKKRILPEWNSYRRAVLHAESPPNQVNDLRNAFYGGCASMFATFKRLTDNLTERKAVHALDEITRELDQHGDEAMKVAEEAKRPAPALALITNQTEPVPVMSTLEIEEYGFAAWCPTQDGSGPMEQVWLNFKLKGIDEAKFAIRFKSREAFDRFMAMGYDIADQVWPGDK